MAVTPTHHDLLNDEESMGDVLAARYDIGAGACLVADRKERAIGGPMTSSPTYSRHFHHLLPLSPLNVRAAQAGRLISTMSNTDTHTSNRNTSKRDNMALTQIVNDGREDVSDGEGYVTDGLVNSYGSDEDIAIMDAKAIDIGTPAAYPRQSVAAFGHTQVEDTFVRRGGYSNW